jgi:osmotically-inducible protein OsmY
MFLNSFNAGAPFDFSNGRGISCDKPAIEAELQYLKGVDCSDVRVENNGPFIMMEGYVSSSDDLARVMRVATEIAGRDRVMCQVTVVRDETRITPFFLS